MIKNINKELNKEFKICENDTKYYVELLKDNMYIIDEFMIQECNLDEYEIELLNNINIIMGNL